MLSPANWTQFSLPAINNNNFLIVKPFIYVARIL